MGESMGESTMVITCGVEQAVTTMSDPSSTLARAPEGIWNIEVNSTKYIETL
jgi:hypothetical protein